MQNFSEEIQNLIRKPFETENKQNQDRLYQVPQVQRFYKQNTLTLKSKENQLCEFPIYYDSVVMRRFQDKLIKNTGDKDNDEDTSYSEIEHFVNLGKQDLCEGKIQNQSSDDEEINKKKPLQNLKAPRKKQGKKKNN